MTDMTVNEWERKRAEAAQKLAVDLGNFVNSMDRAGQKAFIEALGHEHRTLQQSATGVMLKWFAHLSELNDNQHDLRNAHAVKVAKKIRTLLEAEYGSAWTNMPLI